MSGEIIVTETVVSSPNGSLVSHLVSPGHLCCLFTSTNTGGVFDEKTWFHSARSWKTCQTCAGRNTPSSLSIALCWVVLPWQVSALGGTWHDPLASLQLALREDVEETDNQLWNLSGILVPHLNITLFPIQDFHVLHIHRGPSRKFFFTPFSNSHFQPDCFFRENRGKTRRLKTFPVEIFLRELAFEGWCIYSQIKEFGALVFAATMNVRQVVSILVSYVTWHHQFWGRHLENNKTHVGNGGNHAGRLGRVDELDGKVDRCLPLLSTVSQLLLRWNNPEIVLIQTGVKDIVIFNALLFPSASIFS